MVSRPRTSNGTGLMTINHIPHFVNGQRLEGASTRFGDVYNPNTGEVQASASALATDARTGRRRKSGGKGPGGTGDQSPTCARATFEFKRLIEARHGQPG